ncbi:MAG: hypothetical protein ABW133_06870 [Polyangiaceae bacterium]
MLWTNCAARIPLRLVLALALQSASCGSSTSTDNVDAGADMADATDEGMPAFDASDSGDAVDAVDSRIDCACSASGSGWGHSGSMSLPCFCQEAVCASFCQEKRYGPVDFYESCGLVVVKIRDYGVYRELVYDLDTHEIVGGKRSDEVPHFICGPHEVSGLNGGRWPVGCPITRTEPTCNF